MLASEKAKHIRQRGTTEYRDEANVLLEEPGDAVLVERGVPRSLVMRCPDGCGETLTINLDRRAGKAWRMHVEKNATVSLYPSVYKADGCRSHFVVRQSRIIWCEPDFRTTDRARRSQQLEPESLTPVEFKSLPQEAMHRPNAQRSWVVGIVQSLRRALSDLFR